MPRGRYATLLGWRSYADYVTADKMIRTAAHADAFTRSVAALCTQTSEAELAALRAIKAEHVAQQHRADTPPAVTSPPDGTSTPEGTSAPEEAAAIQAYEYAFYRGRLTARDYALNATEVTHTHTHGTPPHETHLMGPI